MNEFKDKSEDKKYFTQIPNMSFDNLDGYELAIYTTIKRATSENGKCFITEETMKRKTKFSYEHIRKAIKGLIKKEFIIFCGFSKGKTRPIKTYEIKDIWTKNMLLYSEKKIPLQGKVSIEKQKDTFAGQGMIPLQGKVEEEPIEEEYIAQSKIVEKFPNDWYDEIFKYYESIVEKREGYKPKYNYGQAKKQLKQLFKEGQTIEQLKGIVEFYACSKKFSEIGASITNCFTPHSINAWLQKGSPKKSYNL